MVLRKIMGLFVCVLVLSSAALATAGIPDPDETDALMNGVTSETVVLFNLPNAGGSAFDEAQIYNDGTIIDATITMVVKDIYGAVVADFPSEDMYLVSDDGGMVPCVGGSAADFTTNAAGETSWETALNAGGWSLGFCEVVVNGLTLNQPPFAMHFNSADMNGDGTVNLTDIGLFSSVYWNAYDFSADFHADGVLDLVDVGRLATGSGTSCP
jgi:hypothetical protein